MEPITTSIVFLVCLAVFGIGYAFVHLIPQKSEVPADIVAVAAGIIGVLALVALF